VTDLTATAEALTQMLGAVTPGSRVGLQGTFGAIRFKAGTLPAGLTLDLAGANVTGPWQFAEAEGLTLLGGTWTAAAPLRFDGGRNIAVRGGSFKGPESREGVGIAAYGVAGFIAAELRLEAFRNGLVLDGVTGFEVAGCAFSDMAADGIQGVAVRKGLLRDLTIHGSRKAKGTEHSDGIQLRSRPDAPPTADIRIEDVEIVGDVQGVICTNKGDNGGFDRITIRRVRARVSFSRAISVVDGRGVTVADCRVSTYPGAEWRAAIVTERCSDLIRRRNRVAAHGRWPAEIDP